MDALRAFRDQLGPAVEAGLAEELEPSPPRERARLARAAGHLALAGEAKRARPALCFALAQAAGVGPGGGRALLDASVAVELIHTASLLHDDVVDADERRRGRSTVNVREGNTVAVLTGDYVLSRALGRLRAQPAALARAVDVVERMTVAALAEVEARGDADFDEARWRAMAAGKTGALFGLCGASAALAAGDSARAARFETAGIHLGVAFQIADDVADLPGGDDLRERNPSFPVVAAVARDPAVRHALAQAWAANDSGEALAPAVLDAVVRGVLRAGGVEVALAAAREEVAGARRAFGADAGHPAVAAVLDWADALVERAAGGSG